MSKNTLQLVFIDAGSVQVTVATWENLTSDQFVAPNAVTTVEGLAPITG